MQKIAKDKNAHKDCPEWPQVQMELAEFERKAMKRLKADYDLNVKALERVYQGEIHAVEHRTKVIPLTLPPDHFDMALTCN
jgi:hypothetical protein